MRKIAVSIEANDHTMLKIERWLAWLHLNTRWGHSGTVAMDCDGDGADRVSVDGIDIYAHRDFVDNLSNISPKPKEVEYIHSGHA